MDIQEFVTSALNQLENALDQASSGSKGRTFGFNKAISFDLAVVNTASQEKQGSGGGKVRIKVVEAGGEKSSKTTVGSEATSRIQFEVWASKRDSGSSIVSSERHTPLFQLNEEY